MKKRRIKKVYCKLSTSVEQQQCSTTTWIKSCLDHQQCCNNLELSKLCKLVSWKAKIRKSQYLTFKRTLRLGSRTRLVKNLKRKVQISKVVRLNHLFYLPRTTPKYRMHSKQNLLLQIYGKQSVCVIAHGNLPLSGVSTGVYYSLHMPCQSWMDSQVKKRRCPGPTGPICSAIYAQLWWKP